MPSTRPVNQQTVMVGLSGGVDSSVAALLLKAQGYHVEGMFMKNWDEDDSEQCSAEQDYQDVQSVAGDLDIPLHARNFASEYWEHVFSYFLDEYRAGRTPNPDILCNKEIKFKVFLEHALDLGAQLMATGHYARVRERGGRFELLKGKDHNKDQSYFLYTLGQAQLSRTLFPVGELEKSEVRAIAARHNLITHDKKDSTGICFIGERDFKAFLQRYIPAQPGVMRTPEGEIVGKHDGLMYYTLGQRQGLGIGGRADSNGQPWFVVDKDLANNVLLVAQGHDHPLLYSEALRADQLHWVSGETPQLPLRCTAKTRYRQADQDCDIVSIEDGVALVRFAQAQRAVTPGQAVVFYQDEVCLGGGTINQRIAKK